MEKLFIEATHSVNFVIWLLALSLCETVFPTPQRTLWVGKVSVGAGIYNVAFLFH